MRFVKATVQRFDVRLSRRPPPTALIHLGARSRTHNSQGTRAA
jgi:hypothetical protein